MSTPFPLEEQTDQESLHSGPMSDPWHGPTKPGFFAGLSLNEDDAFLGLAMPGGDITAGLAYRTLEAAGSGAAKAELALSDLIHQDDTVDVMNKGRFSLSPADLSAAQREQQGVNSVADWIAADAKQRVAAMTPDPTTTGTAVNILHSVGEGAYLATAGGLAGLPGAAALTGAAEASGTFHELTEHGVSPTAAKEVAGLTGITSAAGVLVPGGFGSTLAQKLLTGAATQTGLGVATRYADHKILEDNGFPEMAAQQKIWDSTQVLTDAILGAAFGGIAHLHGHEAKAVEAAANDPGMVDAALATNLAAHDRAAAPGMPIDPAATHAHQDALDTATTQLLSGQPIDVSGTGVEQARFLSRPVDESQRLTEVRASIDETLSQQRDQLVSDSAAFLRGNDVRAAERELGQHETARREAQSAYEGIEEPKTANELQPQILARMEAEDRESYGDDWNSKQYTKLRQRAAAKEARETADQAQQDYLDQKAQAQGQVDEIDERVDRQRNQVQPLTRAEESFKALRAHDAAIAKAGDDPAALTQVIRDEQDRRALADQLRPREPETPEEERANNAPYVPVDTEIAAAGGKPSPDNANRVALVARAMEANPARVESLAAEHQGDPNAFVEASRQVIYDEYAATAQRGEGGAAAAEQRPGTDVGGQPGGRRSGTATLANASEAAPSAGGAEHAGAGATARAGEPGAAAGARNAAGVKGDHLADTVRSVLAERPDFKVPGEDGKPVSASDLMRQAQDEAVRETTDFQKAVTAATNCFGRHGA